MSYLAVGLSDMVYHGSHASYANETVITYYCTVKQNKKIKAVQIIIVLKSLKTGCITIKIIKNRFYLN
jgi:hypothetical protein